jgi:hypothetical protein
MFEILSQSAGMSSCSSQFAPVGNELLLVPVRTGRDELLLVRIRMSGSPREDTV